MLVVVGGAGEMGGAIFKLGETVSEFISTLSAGGGKGPIVQGSIVQLSHPYTTTGKTIALTTQTFVDKVMSLLFNMLSSLVMFTSKEYAKLC